MNKPPRKEPRLAPRTKNERIGFCVAHANNWLRSKSTCKTCGEMPCSGDDCLRLRIADLETEVQDLQWRLER